MSGRLACDAEPRMMGEENRSAVDGSGALAGLFTPFLLNRLTLPNRFVMAPMTRSFSPGGVPGPDVAAYYRRRAEGGVGLIITEGVSVPHGSAIGYSGVDVPDIPELDGAAALEGWRHVVAEVHAAGGLIAPQLWHQGGMRMPGTGPHPQAETLRPSGHWGPAGRKALVPPDYVAAVAAPTRPMRDSEIADVIAAFGQAAAAARELGFDAVAIHGAHGYLIDNFLWRETNLRSDRWGVDVAGRSRFAVAVVKAVRAAVGPGMPIIFRWSQWKLQDADAVLAGSPRELEAMLAPLTTAGVDAFDVSTRDFDAPAFAGSDRSLAGWTQHLTGQPTIAVGSVGLARALFEGGEPGGLRFHDNLPRLAERFAAGEFDLVGVGRMMIAHADWVRRLQKGQTFGPYRTSLLKALV